MNSDEVIINLSAHTSLSPHSRIFVNQAFRIPIRMICGHDLSSLILNLSRCEATVLSYSAVAIDQRWLACTTIPVFLILCHLSRTMITISFSSYTTVDNLIRYTSDTIFIGCNCCNMHDIWLECQNCAVRSYLPYCPSGGVISKIWLKFEISKFPWSSIGSPDWFE